LWSPHRWFVDKADPNIGFAETFLGFGVLILIGMLIAGAVVWTLQV
jgi:hypothetical protein